MHLSPRSLLSLLKPSQSLVEKIKEIEKNEIVKLYIDFVVPVFPSLLFLIFKGLNWLLVKENHLIVVELGLVRLPIFAPA